MIYNSISNNENMSKSTENAQMVRKLEYKNLDYIDGHYVEDGVILPTMKKKKIKMSSTKRFHNCLYLLLGLSKCQRLLMDWLSEEMDDDNMIVSDEHMRAKFIKFLSTIQVEGKTVSYEDQTVANAFQDLTKREDLILKYSKGRYRINPEYYWRGDDKARIEAIIMHMKFDTTETNFKVVKNANEYVMVKKSMLKK